MSFCWISGSTQTSSTTPTFCREIQCLHFYWKPYCSARWSTVNIWICTIIEKVRSPVAIFCPFKKINSCTLTYSEINFTSACEHMKVNVCLFNGQRNKWNYTNSGRVFLSLYSFWGCSFSDRYNQNALLSQVPRGHCADRHVCLKGFY